MYPDTVFGLFAVFHLSVLHVFCYQVFDGALINIIAYSSALYLFHVLMRCFLCTGDLSIPFIVCCSSLH